MCVCLEEMVLNVKSRSRADDNRGKRVRRIDISGGSWQRWRLPIGYGRHCVLGHGCVLVSRIIVYVAVLMLAIFLGYQNCSFEHSDAKLAMCHTNPFLKFCLEILLEKYLLYFLYVYSLYKMFGRKDQNLETTPI